MLGAVLGLGACQDDRRPPPPREVRLSDASAAAADAGPLLVDLPAAAQRLCGETVAALQIERPNLYFVVDRSGSMNESIPGSVPDTRYGAVRRALEALLRDVGHRVNFGVTTFPGDEESGCGGGEELWSLAPGDPVSFALSGELGPKLRGLSRQLAGISPRGGTPTSATLETLPARLGDARGKSYVFLLTDGAPNCNPQAECTREGCLANIEGWETPSGSCDDSVNCCEIYYGPSACLDEAASRTAIDDLMQLSIPTFVIGIPGAEIYASLLDSLAEAGGTARSGERSYYQVSDSDELLSTLNELGLAVSLSCELDLEEPPPDAELVNVFFDDTPVYLSDTDGWNYVSDDKVRFVGPACELLEAGQVLEVHVVFGCPSVIR